ncbi:hypothetical protein ACOSQ2_010907 [Xanthoceras sorbifolium]
MMEGTWLFIVSSTSFLFFLLILKHSFHRRTQYYKNLPPSPASFPIIGHLHLFKEPFHRELQSLSNKYGSILKLSFGSRNVLLISSPSAVEEAFSKNDVAFANRPRLLVGKYLNYNYTTVGAAPYGQHWRNLRRLTALEIFSTSRLNTFLSIRRDEVRLLVKNLHESSSHSFTRVEMKSKLSELSFNVIMRMVAGKRYFGVKADNEEAKRFRDITKEIFEIGGASPEDFIPALRWWNYKSIEKRMKIVQKKADSFMQSLIDEQRTTRNGPVDEGEKTKTMIDSMLSLQESDPNYYTDDIIKGIILTLLSAGTDTSAGTMEWAMSLLLNHPAVLKKARAELDNYVGNERLADESDLAKLPYIQSIVNETLRLYPAAPLLVPHESSEDTTIGGYYVPRQTMLMVNAWAIHRDPKVWDDPTSFKPERFEGLKGESETYKFIPFGLGRRACPGAGLANRVMGLALAALIQCFEWERISEEEEVDMTEGTGITMPKAKPLEAMCQSREFMSTFLSQL